jgi:15-cis-phytoene synthase
MTLQIQQPWEYRLVTWAEEALNSHKPGEGIQADRQILDAAYAHCANVTRTHSRTFYLASGLLPGPKRRAARALYAFCRITDDIVDVDDGTHTLTRQQNLKKWRDRVMNGFAGDNLVALAWADARSQFNIPQGYAAQLIDGVTRDLSQTRYETFNDLAEYSYGVASTVGLMAMHITGFAGEAALPYAVRLGVALQITNILRDVGEDWRGGRLYLPLDELQAFGLSEADIDAGVVDDRWRAFMRFQIERNRCLYADSWAGIAMLDPDGRFAIAAATDLYRAILTDIEANDYDVFNRRAHLGLWGKLSRLPGLWWNTRRIASTTQQEGNP